MWETVSMKPNQDGAQLVNRAGPGPGPRPIVGAGDDPSHLDMLPLENPLPGWYGGRAGGGSANSRKRGKLGAGGGR
jgi:hypothetical protein